MKRNLYLVFFAACFLCIAICGCVAPYEPCDKARSYPFWTDWSDGSLIYIMNDSLAVLSTRRHKVDCNTTSYKREDTTNTRAGLFLVNYRAKKEPLMGDTLELGEHQNYDLEIAKGYFKDSSVLVFDLNDKLKFGFWKIGEKSIKFNEVDGYFGFRYIDASNWINESIIIRQSNLYTMDYILEPEKGRMESFNLVEEYEWMYQNRWENYCLRDGFLSYINGKVACVRNNWETRYAELIVDNIVMDTALSLKNVLWFGNYIGRNYGREILKIDTENFKFDKTFSLWIDEAYVNPRFYSDINNPDNFVSYSGQDLIDFISKGGTK
jgi:hypothetical protein